MFLCLLCSFWKFSKFTVNLQKWQWLNLLLLGRWMADITVLSLWDISGNYLSLFSCKDKRCTQFYMPVRSCWKGAKRSDNFNGTVEVEKERCGMTSWKQDYSIYYTAAWSREDLPKFPDQLQQKGLFAFATMWPWRTCRWLSSVNTDKQR